MINKQTIVVLIGVPGCGKGTLANNLIKEYGFKHISTGDLFRATIKKNTPLGIRLRNIVTSGALVDDQTTNEVMKCEIEKLLAKKHSIILDGYPRTKEQAKFLEAIIKPTLVLLINIDHELAEKRILGRRLCPLCGAVYNTYFNKPKVDGLCDKDNAKLIVRKDDNLDSLKARMDVYDNVTKQLTDYYHNEPCFHKIDANQGIASIMPLIRSLLK